MGRSQSDEFDGGLMLQKKMLNVVGVWPANVNHFSSFVRFLIATIINASCMCSMVVELYRKCANVDDMMDALTLGVSCFSVGVTLLIYRMKSAHLRVLVDSAIEDWSTVKDARHRRIMADYFRRGEIVFVTFLAMCCITAPVFIVKFNAFDKPIKKQILKFVGGATVRSNSTWTLNEMSAATCIYGMVPWYQRICIVMLQVTQVYVLIVVQCGGGAWFFSLTMHLCGQFKILQMNLEEIEFAKVDVHKQLSPLVERHCCLVKFANGLTEVFSSIALLQLLSCMLMGCVGGFVFLVSLESGDTVAAFKSTSVILTIFIQLYLFTYAGDVLETQAESVADAVYNSSWHDLRGNAARDLILVIRRGHLSCHVTAGKFAPMNNYTFKEALKTTMSCLSVLRVMIGTQ